MSGFEAKVVADSISPRGKRITTMTARFPRIILAELNTHRMLSKNSASSRAIPVKKMIAQVMEDPFIPVHWGANQAGMQAAAELSDFDQNRCVSLWLHARDKAVETAERMMEIGLHKQTANRLLEPWMWTTTLITGTEWDNFYALRDHKDAQPEMQRLAAVMLAAHNASTPRPIKYGEWHLPFVSDGGASNDIPYTQRKWSVARAARVSTLNHDGTNPDFAKDEELHDKLLTSGHMSPFEHQATPQLPEDSSHLTGNFWGWMQYRKFLHDENRDNHPAFLKVIL